MDAKGLAEWDKNKEHNVHNQGHSAPAAAQEQPAQDLPRSLSTAQAANPSATSEVQENKTDIQKPMCFFVVLLSVHLFPV